MFSHDVAPMTADEARMLSEEDALSKLIEGCLYRQEYEDVNDLLDRKISLGRRFDDSRVTTCRAWMERHYEMVPARASDRRGYWKPRKDGH